MTKFKWFYFLAFFIIAVVSCRKETNIFKNKTANNDNTVASLDVRRGFEISYWIDMDLRSNNGRGYWFHAINKPASENIVPTSYEIWAAISRLRYTYHALSLYVIYHRQFELEAAKQVFTYWKQHGDQIGVKIIPVVVLEDYQPIFSASVKTDPIESPSIEPPFIKVSSLNFTTGEIYHFAQWCSININQEEFGVYDVYPNRQVSGTPQDEQLSVIKNQIGIKIVRLGLQPDEAINFHITRALEDTWGAQCEGRTNNYWEYPVLYKEVTDYGKNKLLRWVNERVVSDNKKISWNLIPVAWDYHKLINTDPYGYDFPGDNGLTNMNPIPGRLVLSHGYIVNAYSGGSSNPKFGGYSCDLHILQANSANRSESPNFYESIRSDNEYNGTFKPALTEIASIYDLYDN